MKLQSLSRRTVNFVGFFICVALLSFAYYKQFHTGLEPCPLCIFQRVGVIAVGLFFLVAAVHGPRELGARIYGVLISLAAIAGGAVSVRHIYLQHLPADQIPTCGPGLGYMFKMLPVADAIKMAFTGSGECAVVHWRFLGMSIPEWVLLAFTGLLVMALWNNLRAPRRVV